MKSYTTVRVDRSGRVTIPKAMRDSLGLFPGTEIEIETVDGVIVIRRSEATGGEPLSSRVPERIADGLASGEGREATDEVLAELRARTGLQDGLGECVGDRVTDVP